MLTDIFVGEAQEATSERPNDKHTRYEICTITADGREFVAWRRFSEFQRLAADLKGVLDVPFSCSKTFWNRFDDQLISRRKAELEAYLRECALACGGRAIEPLGRFLELPSGLIHRGPLPGMAARGAVALPPVASGTSGPPVANAHVGLRGWLPGGGGGENAAGLAGALIGRANSSGGPAGGGAGFGGQSSGRGSAQSRLSLGSTGVHGGGGLSGAHGGGGLGGRGTGQPTAAEAYQRPLHGGEVPFPPSAAPSAGAGGAAAAAVFKSETRLDGSDSVVVASMFLPVTIARVDAAFLAGQAAGGGGSVKEEGGFEWELAFHEESLIGKSALAKLIGTVGCARPPLPPAAARCRLLPPVLPLHPLPTRLHS